MLRELSERDEYQTTTPARRRVRSEPCRGLSRCVGLLLLVALALVLAACGSSSRTLGASDASDVASVGTDQSAPDSSTANDSGLGPDELDAGGEDGAPIDAPTADSAGIDVEPDGLDVAPVGPTHYLYDPVVGEQLESFPDDYYTVSDETTSTKLRVQLDSSSAPWFSTVPASLVSAYSDANLLDGWGTTAGIVLRFDRALAPAPSGDPDSLTNDALMLVELDGATAKRIPFEVRTLDQGRTLVLMPMLPLTPKTRHGVIVTKKLKSATNESIEPSPVLGSLLDGTATHPRLAPLIPRYAQLLSATGQSPANVSAALVFTTQSIVERSVAIAGDIKGRSFSWKVAPVCTAETTYRRCEGTFLAGDYRQDGIIGGTMPQATYELPVTIYLPPTSEKGPWPVVFFAHGITGERHQAELMIPSGGPLTFAIVAIDAVDHGEHPGGSASDSLTTLARFFEIDLTTREFRPAKLRDNFRQSTYDKLQTLELIAANPDVDGDQQPDLDLAKMGYIGVSLGAIMGSELLALSDRFIAAVLSVGGGRVVSIISDADSFKLITSLVTPPGWTPEDVKRAYPLAQTVVDPGDGANYAPYILGDRLPIAAKQKPSVLCIMALGDKVVPNSATAMLARALGIPLLPKVLLDPGLLPTEPTLPVSGNLDGGLLTAGLFQYDRYSLSPAGDPQPGGHKEIHLGIEFPKQSIHFFSSLLETGKAEIIDPYAFFGTPELP